jgi:putative spermidine/putrescine transport system permease protein
MRLISRLMSLPTAVLLVFLVIPTVVVIIGSFGGGTVIQVPPSSWSTKWYGEVLTDPEWREAIVNSLVVGLSATAVATVAGVTLAVALVGEAVSPRIRSVLELAVIAPMAVPPIELALGGYSLFSNWNMVGSLWSLVPLYAVLGLPFVYLSTISVLERLDKRLIMASASLGASPLRSFRRVTLPLVGPAVATGAAFALITTLDEVVIALFLLGGETSTLPLRIYSRLSFGVAPDVAAVSSLQVCVTVLGALALMAARRHSNRSSRRVADTPVPELPELQETR